MFIPRGVIPATLLVFNDDLTIDESASRAHLRDVGNVEGISAITVNGHASEVASCSLDEQARILDFSLDQVGSDLPVISGIYADGSLEAAEIARRWASAGASALLVFPSNTLGMGGYQRPEMAIEHFKRISDATDLPLIAFVYPAATGLNFSFEGLTALLDQVPSVRAIKDWCNDPKLHEQHIQEFQSRDTPVTVLTTHSSWLMSSLVMGAGGLLSGAGSVVAAKQVALWQAVQNCDLSEAKRINEQLLPFQQAFYRDPFLDMHNRMKEYLAHIERIPRAIVRPPLCRISEQERKMIQSIEDYEL